MTSTQTRQVVSAFHAARTAGDMQAAGAHLAPAFTFQSPLMRFDDPAAYLASHAELQPVVTGLDMISELYGDGEATLIYDLHTATPAGTQRTAEHFVVADGRIASVRLIFDASPWRPMLAALGLVDG
jgi:ketosteroid isomerase-like protein